MREQRTEFTEFYQASRDACLRAVLAGVGDRQLAEELVAEAFARGVVASRQGSRTQSGRG